MGAPQSKPMFPPRPEERIPIKSQRAAGPLKSKATAAVRLQSKAAAPIKTKKPSSKAMTVSTSRPRSYTESRHPITQDRKFTCPTPGCNFTTKYEFNLRRHAQLHNNGRRKGPSQRSTSTKLSLTRTRCVSTPSIENFKCNQCSYSTAHKGNMKRHLANHSLQQLKSTAIQKKPTAQASQKSKTSPNNKAIGTPEIGKRFKCSHCDYHGATKWHVSRHLHTHENIPPLPCPESGCNFTTRAQEDLVKHKTKCHSGRPLPRLSSRPTRQRSSGYKKGCRFCDCCTTKSYVSRNAKGKQSTVVVDTEVDKELSLVNDEAKQKTNTEALMEPVKLADSTELFACMWCEFVGYSEKAAWDHAKCHRQPVRPNDQLKDMAVICLD